MEDLPTRISFLIRFIFNSLILYWAERGFITIEEDCKRGLKLTKLKDLKRPETGEGFNENTYFIEKDFFDEIFGDGEKSGDGKIFYTLSASSSFNGFYKKAMDDCKAEAKQVSSPKTKIFSILTLSVPFVLLFAIYLTVCVAIKTIGVFVSAFPIAFCMGFGKGVSYTPKGSVVKYIMLPFLSGAGGIPILSMLYSLPLEAVVLLISAVVIALIILFLINSKIDLRTEEQLKIYGRVCGFKRFLLLAEIKKLELLVEEDPEYFYKILPYCYVLRITDKLKPKFDKIVMDGPAWYLGELRDSLIF